MGLVLGLSLLTGVGALFAAFLLGREARLFWTRFRRRYAAAFFAVLAAAAIAYACAAIVVAVGIMEFGGLFALFPKDLF